VSACRCERHEEPRVRAAHFDRQVALCEVVFDASVEMADADSHDDSPGIRLKLPDDAARNAARDFALVNQEAHASAGIRSSCRLDTNKMRRAPERGPSRAGHGIRTRDIQLGKVLASGSRT
jgi:hypothetical protein